MRLATPLLSAVLIALLSAITAPAQTSVSPAAAFRAARALYYTPVDHGLQGFDCNVTFNWKQFIEKATNGPVADADPRLQYLKSIQLSVTDNLNGTGELHWTAPTTAPNADEASVTQIRGGMQQMWAGFFQSWNGFYTGDMVSVTDTNTIVERTPTGYHVFTSHNGKVAEGAYTGDFTLRTVHVSTPQLDSIMTPQFETTPRGRLVTSLDSVVKQPPTAPGTAVDMTVHYAPVNGFQLPSELLIDVAHTASFDFHLGACTVRTQLTPKHP